MGKIYGIFASRRQWAFKKIRERLRHQQREINTSSGALVADFKVHEQSFPAPCILPFAEFVNPFACPLDIYWRGH